MQEQCEGNDGYSCLWSQIFQPTTDVTTSSDPPSRPVERAFLLAKYRSGKTSIAFRIAYDEVCRGGNPLFICRKAEIYERPPQYVDNNNTVVAHHHDNTLPDTYDTVGHQYYQSKNTAQFPSISSLHSYRPEILSHIQMKYFETGDDLYKFLAIIQEMSVIPSLIIIDNISNLLPSTTSPSIGFNVSGQLLLMGMIDDVMSFLNDGNRLSPKVRLLVTDFHLDRSIVSNFIRFMNVAIDLNTTIGNNQFQLLPRNVGLSM